MTQFVLDCTSINLPDIYRIPAHNKRISEIFRISRDWCFGISSERARLLKLLWVKTTLQSTISYTHSQSINPHLSPSESTTVPKIASQATEAI